MQAHTQAAPWHDQNFRYSSRLELPKVLIGHWPDSQTSVESLKEKVATLIYNLQDVYDNIG